MRSILVCAGLVLTVFGFSVWPAAPVAAQARKTGPGPGEVESDPIRCWTKTDKTAVYVGEQFRLTLTCAVIETGRIKVVPNVNELDPGTLQLTPFEVVGGSRHEDIQAAPWRYLQYQYTVRLLGDEFFGQDVNVPQIKVVYNIQSMQSEGIQGRDQTYLLPPLPIRIMSLVPRNATDIRDTSRESFADIEARRFRATGELVAAGIFFGFAVVLVGLATVRTLGRYRSRVPSLGRALPARAVLSGGLREIDRLRADVARDGWTPELAGRALAVFRVAGAVALGRPVAQAIVEPDVPGREGQLVLRKGIFRPRRALVSASTTAEAIARELSNGNGREPDRRTKETLEEIRESLLVFNAARYSRNGHLDTAALDRALENGSSAVRRLRLAKLWPIGAAGSAAKSTAGVRGMEWSR